MGVHPGSFCSPPGGTGETVTGVPMVCSPKKTGDRARWRRNGPAPARTPRGRGRRPAAGGSTLPVVNTGIDPTKPAAEPPPAADTKPTTEQPAKVDGHLTDREPQENTWGGLRHQGSVHYHGDGPVGIAVDGLGPDKRIDMGDGEPLADTLGKLATRVVTGDMHPADLPNEVRKIRDRLPELSPAQRRLNALLGEIDHPMNEKPALPDSTPQPLRDLVDTLHRVPACRKDPSKELGPIVALARQYENGKTGGSIMTRELNQVANRRHESTSDIGKIFIDRAVLDAETALTKWFREDPTRRFRKPAA